MATPSAAGTAESWYSAGARTATGTGTPAPATAGARFRERCDALRQSVGRRSSWDIGLLLAVSVVVVVVSSVSLALMDREDSVLQRYRAVFRHVRERRLVATAQLPDPEIFVRVDDDTGEHSRAADLRELRDAAYWLNVSLIFVASAATVVSVGALAVRNLPPLSSNLGPAGVV